MVVHVACFVSFFLMGLIMNELVDLICLEQMEADLCVSLCSHKHTKVKPNSSQHANWSGFFRFFMRFTAILKVFFDSRCDTMGLIKDISERKLCLTTLTLRRHPLLGNQNSIQRTHTTTD